jgi:hypothetical protein
MRPLRKYPNGGDIKDSGELPQINLTASRANWEKQKELRKQLAQTQQDYNNLINDYGLKADDQAQFGFQDYQGGMSSTEELQAKINKLNESYKNVTDQFASANRALADLRTAYPDEWNNKTVSDVITPAGLAAMRKLKIENNAYDNSLRDYYANYGSLVDPNTQYGYGPGATYSAKETRENWMEDPTDFINMINKGVQYGLGLAGAGATGLASRAAGATSLIGRAAPYATAPLTIGSKTFPLINPINTIGLGFGAHSAANLVDPNSASRQSISRAYQNPTTKNILDATGNVTMDALGVLTSPGMGNMLLKAGQGIANTPRAIGNLYEDVATGGYSAIPYAWKNPAAALDAEQSTAMFNKIMQADNFTDAEKAMLKEYQYDNSAFTTPGPKQDAFNALISKAKVTFPENAVVTRAFYNPKSSQLEGFTGTADDIKTISMQNRPSAFSAGVSGKDKLYYGNEDRIVLAGRNLKKVEGNFAKQNYNPLEEGYYAGIPEESLTINYRGPKTNNYGNAFNHKVGDHYYGTSRMTPEEINAEAEAIYNNRIAEFNDPTKTKYFTPSTVEELVNTGNYTPKEAEELVAYQTKVFNEQKALYGDPANKDKALQKIIDDSKGFSQKEGPKEELELFGSGFDMKVVGKFPNKHGGFDYVVQPKNIKGVNNNPSTTFGGPFMMMGPNTPLGNILFKTQLTPSGNITHTLIDDASKTVSEADKAAKTIESNFAPVVGTKLPEGVDPRTMTFDRSVYQDAERASEWLQYSKSTPEILRSYIEANRRGDLPAAWERVMQNYINATGNREALNNYLSGRSPVRPPRFTAPPEPPPAPPVNIEANPPVLQSSNFINLRRTNPNNQNPVYNTLDNLIIDPVKGTIKNSSSANAVTKLKDKISQITNTVSSKLSNINKNIGNYIDKNIALNKPKSLTMQDIYAEVNKALEAGVGIKKAKNVKIKLEPNSAGDTNVLIDIKPYLLENEEKIRQAIPELEQMYPGQSFDEIFADGWINTGALGFRPVHLQQIGSPRTLTQIIKGTPPPEAKYLIGYGDYETKLAGLRKGSEFPYTYSNRIFKDSRAPISDNIIKDRIFRKLGVSGEYNKAINQTVKNLGQRLYSGGTGHYEDGAQRYIKEFLSGRVDIVNPKEAEKFLQLLNDEKTLGEINKVLLSKDKNVRLPDNVYKAIQNVIFQYKKFGGHLYPNRYAYGGSLAPNIPTYYNFRGTPIYRDTTALPFASGGMLDGPPDNPVLPSLKNLNTNEVSALLYNTVANIIERKKAEGKIKPGENLDLRGVVAQILLESGNAKSGLTAKYNNFGGLRATQGFIDRGGKTVAMTNRATGKKFLWRAYDTPEQGLEAQIDFLLDNPRYRKAGVFNAKNTQEYLAAVSKAGYAGGEPTYARKVNQMARSLDKRLKKVTPEKLQELNQTYNVSPTLQPIGVNTTAPINQAAVTPQVQAPVIDPAILAMRENLAIPAKSSIDLLKEPISQLEEMPSMGPELNPPSFVPDEEYYMSGLPTPKFKSRVVPFMGKGASNYQTSGGLRLPYISGWNQNQFINPIAARVQQQTDYDPDYYYGTDEEPGEYEKASLENRPINFEGGFASKKMQRDAERYLQEYDQYNQFLQDSENYGNLMLGRQFKYGSNLYERQELIPSMYASSLGRYYGNGGKFITAGGEYHRVYKNAEGDIIVNHPKEDKGQWDTINLTDKANSKTVSQGVAATKKWHRENPNTYSNGGKIDYSMYDVFQHGTYANGGMIKRADGSYSKRGLWDNIRANAGSGKKPTKEMLAQERKINNQKANGGYLSSFKASNIQTY